MKSLSSLTIFVLLAIVVGCGGPRFEIVEVTGSIEFDDGTKVPPGTRLLFSPGQGASGTSSAVIGEDGKFALTHQSGKKGAELGSYSVEFRAPENAASDFWNSFPAKYQSGPFTSVKIEKGTQNVIQLKLPKE